MRSLLPLLLVACAAAREGPDPVRDAARMPSRWSVGAAYHLWASDLDFVASTATTRVEVDASLLQGAQLRADYVVSRRIDVRLGVEAGFGLEMKSLGATLGAACNLDELPDPWEGWLHGSLVYATLDVDDLPGDFKGALGFEAGLGVSRPVGEWLRGVHLHAELAGRWMEFEFDADPGAIVPDDTVGGFGGRLLLGLDWRF